MFEKDLYDFEIKFTKDFESLKFDVKTEMHRQDLKVCSLLDYI
jgi:hypothetical protein